MEACTRLRIHSAKQEIHGNPDLPKHRVKSVGLLAPCSSHDPLTYFTPGSPF